MVNHPNRSKVADITWTIRFKEVGPMILGNPPLLPAENTYLTFTGSRDEAVTRYAAERAAKPGNVQVTLYAPRGEGRSGEGKRWKEAWGTA